MCLTGPGKPGRRRQSLVLDEQFIAVAPEVVAHNDPEIVPEHAPDVVALQNPGKHVEPVGYAVEEACHDEQGHTEQQGQELVLAGKLDGSGHDEPATRAQDGELERVLSHPARKQRGTLVHQFGDGDDGQRRREGAAHEVAQQNPRQASHVLQRDKAGGAGEQRESVVHHRQESERKQGGPHYAARLQKDDAADGDGYASHDCAPECLKVQCHANWDWLVWLSCADITLAR